MHSYNAARGHCYLATTPLTTNTLPSLLRQLTLILSVPDSALKQDGKYNLCEHGDKDNTADLHNALCNSPQDIQSDPEWKSMTQSKMMEMCKMKKEHREMLTKAIQHGTQLCKTNAEWVE